MPAGAPIAVANANAPNTRGAPHQMLGQRQPALDAAVRRVDERAPRRLRRRQEQRRQPLPMRRDPPQCGQRSERRALSADVAAPAAGSDATRARAAAPAGSVEVGGRSIGRPRILRTHVVLPVQCGDAHAPG
jgi:hypothetical protein